MGVTLLFHVVAGGLGLVSGYVALYSSKGAPLHRRSGLVFSAVMLAMTVSGAFIALAESAAPAINVPAALVTAYLVVTGLTAVRPAPAALAPWLARGAMLVALVVGLVALGFGVEAVVLGRGRDGMPAFPFFLFGVVGLLGATGDLRLLRSGDLRGAARLTRHLWRMTFALLVAAMSFFLGQADELPAAIRRPPLLALPVLAVLATLLYWLWRVRVRRSLRGLRLAAAAAAAAPAIPQPTVHKESIMRTPAIAVLICLLTPAAVAFGHDHDTPATAAEAVPASPLVAHGHGMYSASQQILLGAAAAMPEEGYAFRPVDSVRTFGQIVGHVADSQYAMCSTVLGETNPAPAVEKTKSTKADLVAALREAFTYCQRAYAGLTDAAAVETVQMMGGATPKLGVLNVNNIHTIEHYGNMVTYLRMNGIVPPTSDPEVMRRLRE